MFLIHFTIFSVFFATFYCSTRKLTFRGGLPGLPGSPCLILEEGPRCRRILVPCCRLHQPIGQPIGNTLFHLYESTNFWFRLPIRDFLLGQDVLVHCWTDGKRMSGSLRSHDEWLGRFGSNTHVHFIEQVEYKCSSHWTLMAPQGGWEVSLLCEGPGCFDKASSPPSPPFIHARVRLHGLFD